MCARFASSVGVICGLRLMMRSARFTASPRVFLCVAFLFTNRNGEASPTESGSRCLGKGCVDLSLRPGVDTAFTKASLVASLFATISRCKDSGKASPGASADASGSRSFGVTFPVA